MFTYIHKDTKLFKQTMISYLNQGYCRNTDNFMESTHIHQLSVFTDSYYNVKEYYHTCTEESYSTGQFRYFYIELMDRAIKTTTPEVIMASPEFQENKAMRYQIHKNLLNLTNPIGQIPLIAALIEEFGPISYQSFQEYTHYRYVWGDDIYKVEIPDKDNEFDINDDWFRRRMLSEIGYNNLNIDYKNKYRGETYEHVKDEYDKTDGLDIETDNITSETFTTVFNCRPAEMTRDIDRIKTFIKYVIKKCIKQIAYPPNVDRRDLFDHLNKLNSGYEIPSHLIGPPKIPTKRAL